ncbi:MAG: NAD-dependent epimerase/dehydratase family protein [Firmicutes bacterium]|nr:NAD-dependent epimerase/dehydratase family protein [Bacillota bacterium]
MRIIVTGGAGFIGSNIVDAYIEAGHEVAVIDNLSSGKEENINPKARFYKIDIRSPEIDLVFAKEKPDVLNHHAAQIDVRKSVTDPMYDASVNITGMVGLLQSCVKHGVKKVIFASSGGAIYGEPKILPADESTPLDPLAPYATSKIAGDYYLRCYSNLHGLKYTSLRYGNVYGPRQDPHGEAGVIAIFCQAMHENREVKIFGTGEQLRDYVYVGDVVRANLLALGSGDNEEINIGTAIGTSVNELFTRLKNIIGYQKDAVYYPPRQGELERTYLANAKAKEVLGWEPLIDIQRGLELTAAFFKEKLAREKV